MTNRPCLLSLAVVSSLLLLPGCEDGDARTRSEQAVKVQNAAGQYAGTVLKNPDLHMASRDADAVRELNALSSAAGGSPGGSLLSASIQIDLAVTALAEAEASAALHRATRVEIAGMVAAIQRLEHRAAEHEGLDLAPERRVLDAARTSTQQQLQTATAALSQLDGPITATTGQITQSRNQVTALRERSRAQREQAFNAGDREGYTFILEAVRIDTEADAIERRLADLEIQLDQLQRDHAMAKAVSDQAQRTLASFEQTAGELQSTEGRQRQQAQAIRGEAARIRQSVQQKLDALKTELGGAWSDAISRAVQAANQSASMSDAAISSEQRDAGRLSKVRALQTTGRAHAMKARAYADQAYIVALSGGNASDLLNEQKSAADAARAAYTQALETLGESAQGVDQAAITALRQSLAAAAGADLSAPALPTGE